MSAAPPFPPPMPVSPTIRFFRWALLSAGVVYGVIKKGILAKMEVGIREIEIKQKAIRDAKLAEERRIASDRDVAMLADLIIPPAPPKRPSVEFDDD